MAIFNINLRKTPEQRQLEILQGARPEALDLLQQFAGLTPQAGPLRPGETLPMLQEQDPDLLWQQQLNTLPGLLANPLTAQAGQQLSQQMLMPPQQQQQDPTSLMKNFAFLQSLQQQSPEMASQFESLMTGPGEQAGNRIRSSRQLPGGLVQIVTDAGVKLVEPSEAERELIEQAEIRGAELQGLRAGERSSATGAMKQSIEAFKQLTPIRQNISNLEEGIRLLDEGAQTGPILSRLPSVKAASVKLNNLQNRLGLDVIGNTTFGALSQGELDLALNTALPTGLKPPALRQWMQEKRDSQAKLVDYLNEAAIFLGTPGNSIADFLTIKAEQQRLTRQSIGGSQQQGALNMPQIGGGQQASPNVINFEDLP